MQKQIIDEEHEEQKLNVDLQDNDVIDKKFQIKPM